MEENFIATALEAAKAAGKEISEGYKNLKDINYKSDNTPVTETDTKAEQAIVDVIKTHHPNHAIFAEERGWEGEQAEYTWIIDPLDGTGNFVQQIPFFCTSVALTRNDQPVVGVVYAPILGELFAATTDTAATLNDQEIKVSETSDLKRAVAGFGSRAADHSVNIELFDKITNRARTYRALGSFALHLCYVAAGRLDIQTATNVDYYDGAAGALIARQAGAIVSNFKGDKWQPAIDGSDHLVAANQKLHAEILRLVKS